MLKKESITGSYPQPAECTSASPLYLFVISIFYYPPTHSWSFQIIMLKKKSPSLDPILSAS